MRKPLAGLPPKLNELLDRIKANDEINKRLETIMRNGGASSRQASSFDVLEEVEDRLLSLGWTHAQIRGESKSPANLSLEQVMRPGCKLTNITAEDVTIVMPTGARIKHGRKPRRLAGPDTSEESEDD